MKKRRVKLSNISVLHYVKLVARSLLFLAVLIFYIEGRVSELTDFYPLPIAVWVFFVVEMILRFFPSRLESMGCQKQFARNYRPVENVGEPAHPSWKTTAMVAVLWLALNALVGAAYFAGWIDKGILVLIALFYSVCDIICILFFCPFQTWIMKNRCCTTCRIYNWDFAMMLTPLAFMPDLYTYSLLGCALMLLLRWEITYRRHPERFHAETNACLNCAGCEEKLCSHKKQLQGFLKKHKELLLGTIRAEKREK